MQALRKAIEPNGNHDLLPQLKADPIQKESFQVTLQVPKHPHLSLNTAQCVLKWTTKGNKA